MRRLVVTGASGLLGSHFVPLLREETELCLYEGDLAEGVDPGALPETTDAVVHLAQSRRFRDFPGSAGHVARVNALAAVELAQYAVRAGARRFAYVSTGGVYARGPGPLAEDALLAEGEELGFYAATKLAAERMLAPFARHLDLVVLRPFFIYGPGQDSSMLIPRLVERVRAGEPIRLAGADGMRINPVHASDAAAAVRAALALESSRCINVAGPEILSLREIGAAIGRAVGREPLFEAEGEGVGDLIGDIAAMRRLLVPPAIGFAHGLRSLLR